MSLQSSSPLFRFTLFFALALTLQLWSGAFQSDVSTDPDEPAHFVTGVMVREYVAHGLGASPLEFARNYYLRYPKVSIGHWPPMFYLQQAIWTLVFPQTRSSVLVLIAVQLALLCSLIWPLLRDQFGPGSAWAGALVLMTLPGLASQASLVMTEVPLALLVFLALCSWAAFVDTGSRKHSLLFGLWSSAAILTKGTGAVLAGVPPLSVLFAGRLAAVRSGWFWAPALIVSALCAPWYLLAPGAMQQRVSGGSELGLRTNRPVLPFEDAALFLGWALTLLAILGLLALAFGRGRESTQRGLWASAAALIVTMCVFRLLVKSWSPRHWVEAAPAILFVAGFGVAWFGKWLEPSWRQPAVMLAAAALIGWNLYQLPKQQVSGYSDLTKAIRAGNFGDARTILISGSSVSEGGLVMQFAQAEPSPQRFLVRATKLFADMDLLGVDAKLRVKNANDVNSVMDSAPIDLVIVDRRFPAPFAYQALLEQALTDSVRWQPLTDPALGKQFSAFRRRDAQAHSTSAIETALKKVLRDPVH